MISRVSSAKLFLTLTLCLGTGAVMAAEKFNIIPEQSRIEIKTGKAGLLKSAAHEHRLRAEQMTGNVIFDQAALAQSMIVLTISSASLKLDATGVDPKDAREIQETMESKKVLDVAAYPTIEFGSRAVMGHETSPHHYTVQVTGDLLLHGKTRSVAIPGTLDVEGKTLSVTGETIIKQSDFGIKPYSAALGTIKVKDEVAIRFSLTAKRP